MKATILLSLQLFFSVVTATFVLDKPDCCQERCYSAMDLISNCRCRGEKHHVTTTDGYKLEMHRIQHCHPAPNIKGKPVVLLMHGFFSCSNDFILQCNQSLGFKLAELGYDVWLGNVRGSTYSREHVDLHTDIPDYWNFSWHEMGVYDIPAMMNYITSHTGQERMVYVGHSQGSTAFFVMCSLMKHHCRRIRVAVALSPIAHLGDTTDKLLKSLAKISEPLKEVIGKTRDKEVFPHLNLYSDLALKTCCISEDSCRKFFTATTLKETNNMDASILPQIMCYDPTGSSLGTFSHYLQLINSDDLALSINHKDSNNNCARNAHLLIGDWCSANSLSLNTEKTVDIRFTLNRQEELIINSTCFLGIQIEANLGWNVHVNNISKKISKRLYALRVLKNSVSNDTLISVYYAYIHSLLSYGTLLWGNHASARRLFLLQKRAVRIIDGARPRDHCKPLFVKTGKFCMYDWGKDKNLEVYDSVEPPEYPLEDITCPVYMIASQKDELATYTNVRRTCEKIGDNCELYVTPDSTLSHSDFLFSRQAPYEIYNIVIEYINRHSPAPLVPQCPSLKCLH